jgi:hypothetical protein
MPKIGKGSDKLLNFIQQLLQSSSKHGKDIFQKKNSQRIHFVYPWYTTCEQQIFRPLYTFKSLKFVFFFFVYMPTKSHTLIPYHLQDQIIQS